MRDWVTPDGRERIEIWPKGDANDNANISRFARAVQAVQPGATGEAIGSIEWGSTIVEAFAEAAGFGAVVDRDPAVDRAAAVVPTSWSR